MLPHRVGTAPARKCTNKNAPHCCEAFGAENEKQTRPHKLLLHQFISQEKVPYSNNADAN